MNQALEPRRTAAQNLAGQRFGSLTVVVEQGRDERGILWLCECDCGRAALRTTSSLNQSRKLGQEPCCQACLEELRRGAALAAIPKRHSNWLAYYEFTGGSLYQAREEELDVTEDDPELYVEPPTNIES